MPCATAGKSQCGNASSVCSVCTLYKFGPPRTKCPALLRLSLATARRVRSLGERGVPLKTRELPIWEKVVMVAVVEDLAEEEALAMEAAGVVRSELYIMLHIMT